MVPNESAIHNNFGESRDACRALMLTFILRLIIPINFLATERYKGHRKVNGIVVGRKIDLELARASLLSH